MGCRSAMETPDKTSDQEEKCRRTQSQEEGKRLMLAPREEEDEL